VIAPALRRLAAAVRRGGALPLAETGAAVPVGGVPDGGTGRGLEDRRLAASPSLRELVSLAPDLRAALLTRARDSSLLVGVVAAVLMPAWSLVDRVVEPGQASLFLAVRLLGDLPILLLLAVLWRLPLGRRRPEWLAFVILVIVQAEIAWMIPRTGMDLYYVMGFTVAVYGSGCVLVARPRWTGAVIATTWLALPLAVLIEGGSVRVEDLVGAAGYLGTASVVALLAHVRRHATTVQELVTRLRLEHEQERTRVLLGRLERLSHEDPLTGLANRRRWDAELTSTCAEARSSGGTVAVLLLDLDRFKRLNDLHGHAGGDEVLRQVAALLQAGVRGGDLVARLGGDELAVLLPGADEARASALADELRRSARQLRPTGFEAGEVSLSIGVAAATGAESYPLELVSRADSALYRAKITRNAVGLPTPVS
jgi:diguanylate cyclase (GGDEF)-like protein